MMRELQGGLELPERCHVVLPGLPAGANVALCILGEAGVRLTLMNLGETEEAQSLVRAFNASLGISAQAERAMLAGCLLGWGDQLERSLHVQRQMRCPDTCMLH
jgi:hypothetical protein